MKSQLEEYQLNKSKILIFYDNTSDICLSKNLVLRSRAKHIDIKHYFIRDYVHKGILNLNLIDIKPLAKDICIFILRNLKMEIFLIKISICANFDGLKMRL